MPTSRSKKRSTRSATSKSETNKASDVVETLENDNASTSTQELPSTTQPDLPATEPDFSSPGSILQSIFDSQNLKPRLPRKRLKPPGLPRSLLFKSLPLPPSSFDCGKGVVDSGETLTAMPLEEKISKDARDLLGDITKGKNNAVNPTQYFSSGKSQKTEDTASSNARELLGDIMKGKNDSLNPTHSFSSGKSQSTDDTASSKSVTSTQGRNKFVCPMPNCDAALPTPSGLERHIRERHENHILNCPYCDYTSKYKQNIRRHVKVHHEAASKYRESLNQIDYIADDKMDVDVDPISSVKTEIGDKSGDAFHGFGEESGDKSAKASANKTNEVVAVKDEPKDD